MSSKTKAAKANNPASSTSDKPEPIRDCRIDDLNILGDLEQSERTILIGLINSQHELSRALYGIKSVFCILVAIIGLGIVHIFLR